MNKHTIRGFRAKEQDSAPGTPIRFTASTEGIKRDGLDLSMSQWDLRNFEANPVFLWAHDYTGRNLPLGRVELIKDEEERVLKADVTFDQNDPFAKQVEHKYRNGFLHAVSVGWDTLVPEGKMLRELKTEDIRLDLLDLSGVPVPGDPDALMERFIRSLQEDNVKLPNGLTLPVSIKGRALPPKSTKLAHEDTPWDEEALLQSADRGEYEAAAAWADRSRTSNKLAFLFLHHDRDGEAVWRGVATAMVDLYLSTVEVPSDDRKGVYDHLVRHYQQFNREAPEWLDDTTLEALGVDEIEGLFLEGESRIAPDRFQVRKGAVLSRKNRSDLDKAIEILTAIRDRSESDLEDESLQLLHDAIMKGTAVG